MATQGLITVKSDGMVIMKVVAGKDGDKAKKVANKLKRLWPQSIEDVYDMALEMGFGCPNTLVTLTAEELYSDDETFQKGEEERFDLYFKSFEDPKFNPRWHHGMTDHLVIIEV